MIRGIHHVAIHTSDLDRLRSFYEEAFGFAMVGKEEHLEDYPEARLVVGTREAAARVVMMKAGNCFVELFEWSAPKGRPSEPLKPNDFGYTHFCVDVVDIEAEYDRLSTLGMTFVHGAPVKSGGDRGSVYGHDPDGNIIEIAEIPQGDELHLDLDRSPMSGVFGFAGRGAIVTGAGSGIGKAVAELFAGEGARVVLVDLDADALAATTAAASGRLALAFDVADADGWTGAVERIRDDFGAVEIMVNSAGIIRPKPVLETSDDDYRAQIRVNQDGTFFGMRALAPLLSAGGSGSIVNVSSIAAPGGYPDTIAYAASKAAILSMSRSAARELASIGIRVNSVLPGIIDTPMQNREDEDPAIRLPGRMGRPEEVARAIAFLASDMSSYTTGAELLVDGGVTLGGGS